MNKLFCTLLLMSNTVFAQNDVIRLYKGPAPGSENWKQTEKENNKNMWQTRLVYNVADPTLTVFKADPAKANGTALVICPGGAFHALSIDSEGFDAAKWLSERGVTCFVLKYRLVECKTDDPAAEVMQKGPKIQEDVKPVVKLAMADGIAAVTYVRKHASDFGINSNRIGIMGFSAGGTVAASVALNYSAESKPNFVAPIYLAYEWSIKSNVPSDAPPLFALAATDDQLGLAPQSIQIYNDWIAAKKPAEVHLFARGGHGFGMRRQNIPTDHWIEIFYDWLSVQGFLKK